MRSHTFPEQSYRVMGALSPIEWDKDGTPKRFSIFTEWGEDFIVTNSHQRSRFKPYLNRIVEAHGKAFTNEYGEKFLYIKKINIIGFPGSGPQECNPYSSEHYNELPIHISHRKLDEIAIAT